ncbi:MAG TPA: hypothetical protein VG320_16225 [Paraburkholderia sp.]|uniref:hypothetical protein n=1 Tax=Paraburkholderia sp. TaxID=1926495 RepID=UPI002DF14C3D|nr:hypothetical protein [Paraburkholderia sp.]
MARFLPSRKIAYRIKGLIGMRTGFPQGCEQNLWKSFPLNATYSQSSVLFKFNRLDVYMLDSALAGIRPWHLFCGEYRGGHRSQTIRDGTLLELTAADHGRILNDDAGLSGKVYAGAKGMSIHFRYPYRFQGEPCEIEQNGRNLFRFYLHSGADNP